MRRRTLREIVRLAWPVFIAQIAVMANGLIDTLMAGRYSTLDLAAVGIGASIYVTLFVTLNGVLIALIPICGQLFGARRDAEIGEEIRQSLWFALWLSALSLFMLMHPEPLFRLANLSGEVEARTRDYLQAICWGVPAAYAMRVFQGFSTAVSRPRPVMLLNLCGLLLKVPLNAMLMYGYFGLPAMGGAGCALATSIIAWLICIAAWIYCVREPAYARFDVFRRWSWPHWRPQWQLLALGGPICVTFLVDVTAFTFMALFIARFGVLYSAAHQIAASLTSMCFMLPLAIGNATAVLCAQAIGAGDPMRARRTGWTGIGLGLGMGLAVGFLIALAAPAIAALYSTDEAVRTLAATLLLFVAAYHCCDAVQAVAVNALRAYRRTVLPMLFYGLTLWGLGLGGGYLLGIEGWLNGGIPLRAEGFWAGGLAGMALTAVLGCLYFARVSAVGLRPKA